MRLRDLTKENVSVSFAKLISFVRPHTHVRGFGCPTNIRKSEKDYSIEQIHSAIMLISSAFSGFI